MIRDDPDALWIGAAQAIEGVDVHVHEAGEVVVCDWESFRENPADGT